MGKLLISPGVSEEASGKNEQETEIYYIDTVRGGVWQVAICFEGPRPSSVLKNVAQERIISHGSLLTRALPAPQRRKSITLPWGAARRTLTYSALLFGDTDQTVSHPLPHLPLVLNRCSMNT